MILVDAPRPWPNVSDEAKRRGHGRKRWCHMVSDESVDELHEFAQRLGLRREWFQGGNSHPHYDLTEGKRWQALRLGAREATHSEIAAVWEKATPPQNEGEQPCPE